MSQPTSAPARAGTYRRLLGPGAFRTFWLGFTLSVLGDAMTRVALLWIVYERTGSARAVGMLTVAYTAPVLVGGFVAGPLLDRFDRRRVMIADNVIRAVAMAVVPVLLVFDALPLGYVYAAAAVYGFFMMISLAGCPALLPSLVSREDLSGANALETMSYTLAGVAGAPLAGWLISRFGAAPVVAFDALSYLLFAAALTAARPAASAGPAAPRARSAGVGDAVRLLLGSRVLLATTLMFMAFNVGFGALMVWLPFHADRIGPGGAGAFGLLLGVLAAGEFAGAFVAGAMTPGVPLGFAIGIAQALAGGSLVLLLLRPDMASAALALLLVGIFSAPLTIWAQTLRMQVIPEEMRGRAFALLRTLMQGATPIGGALAGFGLEGLGAGVVIAATAMLMGLPGVAGCAVGTLRRAGAHAPREREGGRS